jgi:hypothetical protein
VRRILGVLALATKFGLTAVIQQGHSVFYRETHAPLEKTSTSKTDASPKLTLILDQVTQEMVQA